MGFRNITNNIAFELFGDGTATRGLIGSATNPSSANYVITLNNAQLIVNFEVGMTLVNFLNTAGTISNVSSTTAMITAVNRETGVIQVTASSVDSSWTTVGQSLGVAGDVVSGSSSIAAYEALSGLAAWIPSVDPSNADNFWGVNRSVDPTRLAGLRYNASSYTIEEGLTNALAFLNREGGKPDLIIMDFASYAALVNALGKAA